MKIVSNTLTVERETWKDPGDYSSNAGAGPLPSRSVVMLEGSVVLQLAQAELDSLLGTFIDCPEEWLEQPGPQRFLSENVDAVDSVAKVTAWDFRYLDVDRVTLYPETWEVNDVPQEDCR